MITLMNNIVPLESECAKLPLLKVAVQHLLTPRGIYTPDMRQILHQVGSYGPKAKNIRPFIMRIIECFCYHLTQRKIGYASYHERPEQKK